MSLQFLSLFGDKTTFRCSNVTTFSKYHDFCFSGLTTKPDELEAFSKLFI